MKIKYRTLCWLPFYILSISFIVFCITFATPFLSGYAAQKVVVWAGCKPAGFDTPFRCPDKNLIGERFGPLTAWFVSFFMAPIVFFMLFWDVLLVWVFLIVISLFAVARQKNSLANDEAYFSLTLNPVFLLPSKSDSIYASLFQRFCAALIDYVIIYGIVFLAVITASIFLYTDEIIGAQHEIQHILTLKFFPFIAFLWFFIWKTATPGKKLLSIQIVDASSEQLATSSQLMRRFIGYLASVAFFGLGFLFIVFDKRKQGWHDHFAKTIVIRK